MIIGLDARMYRSSVAGIGRYCQNLIKNLLEIDSENQYVLFMTSADAEELNQKSKIKNQKDNVKIKIVDIPHFSVAEQTKFPKIIEQEKLDLMHFLNFNYPVRYKGKFITTIHDLTLLFYPETARDINFLKFLGYKYVMKKAIQNAAKIIAVSENTKKDIINKFQIPNSKIQTIYEAADDKIKLKTQNSKLKTAVDKLKIKYHLSGPVILYVGQFRAHKNLKGLMAAFKILQETLSCQLVLLGGKKEDWGDIIAPGFVSDEELAAWYKIVSVFVMPSFYEGFGLPGLEAMSAGTPVVASNRASLPEIYQDAAIYFDPFSLQDISSKIKMVLEDKKLRKKMITRGKIVAGKYSWEKAARQTLEVYQEIKNQRAKIKMIN